MGVLLLWMWLAVSEQALHWSKRGASRLQVCQFHCYVASLVRFLVKKNNKKRETFLSADARLRGEYYKVSKIDHYDVVKSFEGCVTLLIELIDRACVCK